MVPGRKIVWTVLDNHFSVTDDATEWTGTDIVFEITKSGDRTELRFTHLGLVPAYECYDVCIDGWSTYIASLRDLVATGEGRPYAGEARTASEHALIAPAQAQRRNGAGTASTGAPGRSRLGPSPARHWAPAHTQVFALSAAHCPRRGASNHR